MFISTNQKQHVMKSQTAQNLNTDQSIKNYSFAFKKKVEWVTTTKMMIPDSLDQQNYHMQQSRIKAERGSEPI